MKHPANRPCPRPGEMIVVKTKAGSFWRMKRAEGTAINGALSKNKSMIQTLSPAAARFVSELRPYMLHMAPKRINLRVKSCLQRSIKEKGELDYEYMERLDFQPEDPTWKLMRGIPGLRKDDKDVVIQIPIPEGGAVKAVNTFIKAYRFSLIMVVGDPTKDKLLQTFHVTSPWYPIGGEVKEGCELRLVRPDEGEKWICILHIECYMGKGATINSSHNGMEVVGWDSRPMHPYSEAGARVQGERTYYKPSEAVQQAYNDNIRIVERLNGGIRQAHPGKNVEVEVVRQADHDNTYEVEVVRQVHYDKKEEVEVVRQAYRDNTDEVEVVCQAKHEDKGGVEVVRQAANDTEGVWDRIAGIIDERIQLADPTVRPDRREKIRAVAFALLNEPGLSAIEIELKTALPLKSVQRHLKALKDAGLIQYRGTTRNGGYYITYTGSAQ